MFVFGKTEKEVSLIRQAYL